MPYRIIKKVKQAIERPLVRSTDHAMNFGVDLDDEKTWKLYPLYRSPRPSLFGEVLQLMDENGNQKYVINEDFEFEIYCSQYYGRIHNGRQEIIEKRFMYLPRDLVLSYGIDEGMAIDLLLREVIRVGTREEIFPKILKTGPMDIAPKVSQKLIPKKEITREGETIMGDLSDFLGKIRNIQSLMVLVSTGRADRKDKETEYREIRKDLKKHFLVLNSRKFF